MPIEFTCKSCQKRLRCPDSAAGSKARCPQCSEVNSVPLFSDPPAMTSPTTSPSTPLAGASDSYELQPPSPASPPSVSAPAYASPPSFAPAPSPAQPPAFPIAPPFEVKAAAPAHGFGDVPLKEAANPYAAPTQASMSPPQPTDQSGLASSLGVVSIVVGGLSLTLGFCCCPIGALGSATALGCGIFGWVVAAKQLKQTKYAPYLRHLEPPARTALTLCIIGTVISGLATLLVGGSLVLWLISLAMNPSP